MSGYSVLNESNDLEDQHQRGRREQQDENGKGDEAGYDRRSESAPGTWFGAPTGRKSAQSRVELTRALHLHLAQGLEFLLDQDRGVRQSWLLDFPSLFWNA
jgi:hypothetical protein